MQKDTIQKRNTKNNIVQNAKKNEIFIKGARGNNLKDVNLTIPRNQLIVITGVSGSGKSSLTIDTLFAEGQRRYVESLSSYARQFLMRMKKPEVDYIHGICPAIAIEQKVNTRNSRSTVGSLTEIYDYLRILFARAGKTYSPVSGKLVRKHEVSDVVDYIHTQSDGTKVRLFSPINVAKGRSVTLELDLLMQKGFTRIAINGADCRLDDLSQKEKDTIKPSADLRLLIDRFVVKTDDKENRKRIADSILTTFVESQGDCIVDVMGIEEKKFNNRFELDGILFEEPSLHLFNYNNPYGACKLCEGYGKIIGIDDDKVIPDKSKSVVEGAIACWKGEKNGLWKTRFLNKAHEFDFPVHTPYQDLKKAEQRLLWTGNKYFEGIDAFFQQLQEKAYKIQNRVMLARYRGKTTCHECSGNRLRKEASYVKIADTTISDLVNIPLSELNDFFETLTLDPTDTKIASRLILEITNRLEFMLKVGLGYLTLDRLSSTLSGGETQRINLTRTLGSNLTSSLYILDEPSIGLHPRDTSRLVEVLKSLRDLGNTVVVVEHEEDVIANADYLVDMGPEAGIHGGEVVFAGPYSDIHKDASESLTAKYMSNRMQIPIPQKRRPVGAKIEITNVRQHNLKNFNTSFPLNTLTVVTGVSGSGKTTLVKQILYPALKRHFGEAFKESLGLFSTLEGDIDSISQVELINQSPIGKSSRSNPVTYVKAYDAIRKLFSDQQLSLVRGFKPKHFSFNVEGGRCETCKGEGETVVSMQFLADVRLICDECNGNRFKDEVLDVKYNNKSISEVLQLSIEEALEFFEGEPEIIKKIRPLYNVGLGYVKLGQASSTLSGGEAQRVKLASYLGKERSTEHIFFIFDEPTTGLHFHDIQKLLDALNALVDKGHTVLVVEHNMEVIKSGDWIIDLGPEGGKNGGHLVFEGRPEDLAKCNESYTGKYLAEKLKSHN